MRSERAEGVKESKSIGFLADKRRMNVSLSRARLCLVVVGNAKKLYTSEKWKKLIDYSYGLDSLFDAEKLMGPLSTYMFQKDVAQLRQPLPSDLSSLIVRDLTKIVK